MIIHLLFILSFLNSSIIFAQNNSKEWFMSKSGHTKGQALVIHGLNNKPESMTAIINELQLNGKDVLLVKLSGHVGNIETMKVVNRVKWLSEVESAFKEVELLNKIKGGDIIFAGYSLGAAAGLDYLSSQKNPSQLVSKMVLFAPAIDVRASSHLVKASFVLGNSFVIPSFSPECYRAQSGTTVAAYKGLFDIVDHLKAKSLSSLNINTTIFIDPKDELVSYSGIKDLIKDQKLNNWKVIAVSNNKATIDTPYHHLIIDPESLGKEQWTNHITPVLK